MPNTGGLGDRSAALVKALQECLESTRERLAETTRAHIAGGTDAERARSEALRNTTQRHRAERESEIRLHEETRRTALERATDELASVAESRDHESGKISAKAGVNEKSARKALEEAIWATETVYEANERRPRETLGEVEQRLEARRREFVEHRDMARNLMKRYRQRAPAIEPAAAISTDVDPAAIGETLKAHASRIAETLKAAHDAVQRLANLTLARLFHGPRVPLLLVLAWLAAGAGTMWWRRWQPDAWLAGGLGGVTLVFILIMVVLYVIARRTTTRLFSRAGENIAEGLALIDACTAPAQSRADAEEEAMRAKRDRDVAVARQKYEPILEEITRRREGHLDRIRAKYPTILAEIEAQRDTELKGIDDRHAQRLEQIEHEHDETLRTIEREYTETLEQRENRHREARTRIEKAWHDATQAAFDELGVIQDEATRLFPSWDPEPWAAWSPPTTQASSFRFGAVDVDLAKLGGGPPDDQALSLPGPSRFGLPATIDFAGRGSLLVRTSLEGRDAGIGILQSVMLRLLATLPPGKVRFTIFDPVGLGENFAGFMHLADYADAFVGGRIWTESKHIEQRLGDLTEHMETVIQKYLRNEFPSIEAYNIKAGEIAEPYRFLVMADFPTNVTENAARRLASIVNSGARCGVYTLILQDRRVNLPRGFTIDEVEAESVTLVETDGRFRWKHETLGDLPLHVDPAPSETLLNDVLHKVGAAAQDATRVEVPFAVIAPPEDRPWSRTCDKRLAVPLGRAGATKLQELVIGEGTAQHVLIAGKTGSGKSTLLHVLVTNLALWYSPEEVEFYLVDFKKGVEFKTYATHDLPHARTVAVESDREFGLSVLQRLDRELKERGEVFRKLGVQDLAGYRKRGEGRPLPRTLLIVDEFQEIFVEDDRIGQEAALLLDRIVRQGRAFGLHVILGSQTLGGAYSLARSTMGQMQIRIALQCSEADSYLIMNEDNAAARLLSRPGEAIYNDSGGAIEGNSPFQIVWLPDHQREGYLETVHGLAVGYERPEPMIVFEGNAPAVLDENHLLEEVRLGPPPSAPPARPRAWIGEAIAIKGPTEGAFPRHGATNLLIVGQQEETPLAMMASALASLSPQLTGDARFALLDGITADSTHAGYLAHVMECLSQWSRWVGPRGADDLVSELHAELKTRQGQDELARPPAVFFCVHGLQRFRSLKSADDFGFSMSSDDDEPSTDRKFVEILRDGPLVGMHTILWCDSVTNLTRMLDRGSLQEFGQRVALQMSGADSTQLIDAPTASNLGLQRALFYAEEEGHLEKFRPYALPTREWWSRWREARAPK